MTIENIRLRRLHIPLSQPYKLAIGDIAFFDTLLVELTVEGRAGIGEATILHGYTDETGDESWTLATALAGTLRGRSQETACRALEDNVQGTAPFTATAFQTAIEMATGHPLLGPEKPLAVPLLYGINALSPPEIEREIEAALAAGYRTLKIKVGFELEADLARVRSIQRMNRGRAMLRVDANQGYSREDGCAFARRIAPDSIQLLEQPCDADDWGAAQAVAAASAVPLMLDESIYGLADIERAASIGVDFVKLKLMKLGSLDALARGLDRIRELGMQPVLGNGVASDVGCWMEGCIAGVMIDNAGEMNGYLRQRESIVDNPIAVTGGAMQIGSGATPRLLDSRLQQVTVGQYGRGTASMEERAWLP